jgi:membrane-anchored glycerophosphoryl diester phosphodiesterase (GDPDase)
MDLETQSRERAAPVPRLPSFGVYLRDVLGLGRRTFRPALPALALLYFYGVGTGVFLAVNPDSDLSQAASVAAYLPTLASLVAFLPMLMLIYTPFLPLQDSLLRGTSITFGQAIRRVLEVAWHFLLSGAIQVLILLAPIVPIAAIAWLIVPGGERLLPTGAHAAGAALLTVSLSLAWFIVAAAFTMFATPAVVLDGRGPIRSVGLSLQLVAGHFWGLLGRFLGFILVVVLAGVLASTPISFLTAAMRAAGAQETTVLLILESIWSSAVSALLFPFGVAALVLLYRALNPARAVAQAAGTDSAAMSLHSSANPLLFE